MNPFERHGLAHLSASSLNCYAEQPAFWALKYLHGYRDDGSAAAWRGSAVEAGLDHWLYRRDSDAAHAAALVRFELDAVGLCDDETQRERDRVPAMLDRAMLATSDLPEPTVRQLPIEYWFDGIEVPIVGYIDYEWPDRGVDLKTVGRMPSQIPTRHANQVSLYQLARNKPYRILYVTNAKSVFRDISADEAKANVKRLEWYAHTIRRALSVFSCKHDLARIFVPDFDHYFWKREDARLAAAEIWQ